MSAQPGDDKDEARYERVIAETRQRRYLSREEAQTALLNALGFAVGDGVQKIVLTIEAGEIPTVEVTFCGSRVEADNTFVPFVQRFDLVRKQDTDATAAA